MANLMHSQSISAILLIVVGAFFAGCAGGDGAQPKSRIDTTTISAASFSAVSKPTIPLSTAPLVTPSGPPPAPTSNVVSAIEIGHSSDGYPLEVYTFGNGPTRVVFIGGIHGGSEWNTVLLAYRTIDHFEQNPDLIPDALTLQILPVANPDGQNLAAKTADIRQGRFNGNGVDLNRNWDCQWTPNTFWGDVETSGGTEVFSEPESQLLRDFLVDEKADSVAAVIFWHSARPGVFAGGCSARHEQSDQLAQVYADASGYPFILSFTSYVVTGDATDWLAAQGIPAIVVELNNHDDLDWPQNLQGILATFQYATSVHK